MESYCNYALRNITETLASIYEDPTISLSGLANDMYNKIENNPNYKEVDYETAAQNAQDGGLSIMTYYNPDGHGHVLTLAVSENVPFGLVLMLDMSMDTCL